jgi:outer membrane lipoprotein-sorting protein
MRFTPTALILVALAWPAHGADDPDAKALLARMDANITKAKSLQAELDMTALSDKTEFLAMKGRILVASGNKLRLELRGKAQGKPSEATFVSDGIRMRFRWGDDSNDPTQETDQDLGATVLGSMARTGIAAPLFFVVEVTSSKDPPKKDRFDLDKMFAVSDVKLGKKEVVNGVEAQAVSYTVTIKFGSKADAYPTTVWIDPKTNLPVKRVLTGVESGKNNTITETYSRIVIDGKVDEKEFELPKGK